MDVIYGLVNEDDAASYLDFFKAVVSETDNLACTAKEANAMTEEDERVFIKNMNDSGSFSVAAFSGSFICASCDIRIERRERLKHRAEMGIAVRKEYWGKGVAQSVFDFAKEEAFRRGVKKICLTVRSDNERAKAFYVRNGFILEGRDEMLFFIDGKYIDGEHYSLILH